MRTPLVRHLPKPTPKTLLSMDRRRRRGLQLSYRRKWGYDMPLDLIADWASYEEQNARMQVAYYARAGRLRTDG